MASKLFEFVNKIWENGESKTSLIKKWYDYWEGLQSSPAAATLFFNDQPKTANNVVNEVCETRLSSLLDTQYSVAVVPKINTHSSIETIKLQKNIADIYNSEMQAILERNKFDDKKEIIGRWGEIAGFGVTQVTFEANDEHPEGDVKIITLDPRKIKWDKNIKSQESLTFFGYEKEMSPMKLKKLYGRNQDGTWNEEITRKIDRVTESQGFTDKGERKGIVSVNTDQGAELAFAHAGGNISAGKTVKVVVLFLLDDSVYAPEKSDDLTEKQIKMQGQQMYPYGRMIVFSPDKQTELIFEDRAAPKGFKGLGNIDFYNPIDFDDIVGKSIIEFLIPTQDRINGAQMKSRQLINDHLSVLIIDKTKFPDVQDNDFIRKAVIFSDGKVLGEPYVLSNGNIEEAMKMMEYVKELKSYALNFARINETMLSGQRQPGTTSAEQVESLNEAPMASIRMIQKNFKDYLIRVGEKVVSLIQEYYTVPRLVEISTGEYKGQYAKFSQNNNQKVIELVDEASGAVQELKIKPEWEFCVKVTAGTDIPRSRKENAVIIQQLFTAGVLGDPQATETKEKLLKAIDLPNWREFISELKKKDEQAAKAPPELPFHTVLKNPDLSNAIGGLIKNLDGYGDAIKQILEFMGLGGEPATLEETPAKDLFSKSKLEEMVVVAPDKVSDDPAKAAEAQVRAAQIINKKEADSNAFPAGTKVSHKERGVPNYY